MQTLCAGQKITSNLISPQPSVLNYSSKHALPRIATDQPCLTVAREQKLGLLFWIRFSQILVLLWSQRSCYFIIRRVTLSKFRVTPNTVQVACLLLHHISDRNHEVLGKVCLCHTLNLFCTCLKLQTIQEIKKQLCKE